MFKRNAALQKSLKPRAARPHFADVEYFTQCQVKNKKRHHVREMA